MTDWWAAMNDEGERASGKNTAAMIRGQNDVYMVVTDSLSNSMGDNLAEALERGSLTRGQLQRSARNLLGMLMRSPVMARSLGRVSEEEAQAEEQMDAQDRVDFDLVYHPLGQELTLDLSGEDTSKGRSLVYGFAIETNGLYDMRMRLKVEASELAQVPMSVFVNGKLRGTLSFNGGDSGEREIVHDLGVFFGTNNFVKLYFAQSGLRIEKMTVTLREELGKPDWLS